MAEYAGAAKTAVTGKRPVRRPRPRPIALYLFILALVALVPAFLFSAVLLQRNNEAQDLVMKSGESRRVGNVIVRVATCERTLPWETPPEMGAFVQVFIEERARTSEPLSWRRVFSGWLFKNSPSLNVVEHPVYDVWLKDCAMRFPGEEADASASASSAAKPAGRPSGAPSPAASASPAPTPSPVATSRPAPMPEEAAAE